MTTAQASAPALRVARHCWEPPRATTMTGSAGGSPLTVRVRVAVPSVAGVNAALASIWPVGAALTTTVATIRVIPRRG